MVRDLCREYVCERENFVPKNKQINKIDCIVAHCIVFKDQTSPSQYIVFKERKTVHLGANFTHETQQKNITKKLSSPGVCTRDARFWIPTGPIEVTHQNLPRFRAGFPWKKIPPNLGHLHHHLRLIQIVMIVGSTAKLYLKACCASLHANWHGVQLGQARLCKLIEPNTN